MTWKDQAESRLSTYCRPMKGNCFCYPGYTQSSTDFPVIMGIESWNILSWNGLKRITKSSSWPCTGLPQQFHSVPESVVQTIAGLWGLAGEPSLTKKISMATEMSKIETPDVQNSSGKYPRELTQVFPAPGREIPPPELLLLLPR